MRYSNFRNKYEGSEFVDRLLSLGTVNGYFLQTEVTGQYFGTKCDIKKIENRRYIQFAEEKAILENAILSLQQRKRKNANNSEVLFAAADDEVVVLALPVKQQKTNLPVIDISWITEIICLSVQCFDCRFLLSVKVCCNNLDSHIA